MTSDSVKGEPGADIQQTAERLYRMYWTEHTKVDHEYGLAPICEALSAAKLSVLNSPEVTAMREAVVNLLHVDDPGTASGWRREITNSEKAQEAISAFDALRSSLEGEKR